MSGDTSGIADQVVRLPDGRSLGFRVWGDPAGEPMLMMHGTPGSRLEFAIGHEGARRLGLAVVVPDRWGYGMTSMPPRVELPAFAADMGALMDHLGYRRFAVGGISGGGPFASAVAACLGGRITALALICPVGPIADARCAASLSYFHQFCFTMLPRHPLWIAGIFGVFRWSLVRAPTLATRFAVLRGGRPDKELMARADIRPYLLASFREGLRQGLQGPITDLEVFSRPWGVDLARVQAPARLWIGTADRSVPIVAAQALSGRVAGCMHDSLEGEGHLWVAANHARVLDWTASTLRGEAQHAR
jgi:pimeloyl-ACP methyl ester carboxylesterase